MLEQMANHAQKLAIDYSLKRMKLTAEERRKLEAGIMPA
jgi:hypothetical protein